MNDYPAANKQLYPGIEKKKKKKKKKRKKERWRTGGDQQKSD